MQYRAFTFVLAAAFAAVGCDQSGEQRAASTRQFDEALATFQDAGRGYVPLGEEAGDDVTAGLGDSRMTFKLTSQDRHRRQTLLEAEDALLAAAEAGTSQQRVTARKLLSDVYASQARQLGQEALSAWGTTETASASLIEKMLSLTEAHSRAGMFESYEPQLIAQLRTEQRAKRGQLEQLRKDAADLQQQIQDLDEQIDDAKQRQQQALEQMSKFQEQSFESTGQERYELQVKSISAQRDADKAAADAEQLGVQREVLQSELNVVQKQVTLIEGALSSLEDQAQAAQRRDNQLSTAKTESIEERGAVEQELSEAYTTIISDFATNVAEPMNQAIEQMDQAIEALEPAVDIAGPNQRNVRVELLLKKVGKARLLSNFAMARAAFGHSIAAVSSATSEMAPQQRELFTSNLDELAQRQEQTIARAVETIEDAAALASELSADAAEGDTFGQIAAQQVEHLETYRDQAIKASFSGSTAGE